jgi:hypothetical protein
MLVVRLEEQVLEALALAPRHRALAGLAAPMRQLAALCLAIQARPERDLAVRRRVQVRVVLVVEPVSLDKTSLLLPAYSELRQANRRKQAACLAQQQALVASAALLRRPVPLVKLSQRPALGCLVALRRRALDLALRPLAQVLVSGRPPPLQALAPITLAHHSAVLARRRPEAAFSETLEARAAAGYLAEEASNNPRLVALAAALAHKPNPQVAVSSGDSNRSLVDYSARQALLGLDQDCLGMLELLRIHLAAQQAPNKRAVASSDRSRLLEPPPVFSVALPPDSRLEAVACLVV